MGNAKRTFAKEKMTSRIVSEQHPDRCFAALKYIEQLVRDGLLSEAAFKSILNDYADLVDASKFSSCGREKKNV